MMMMTSVLCGWDWKPGVTETDWPLLSQFTAAAAAQTNRLPYPPPGTGESV